MMISTQSQIMQAAEPAAQIFGRSTEELMRVYAQYIIFGIDLVTGIVIAITAAMAIIGFFKVITRTKHPHHHTIDTETIRLRLARGMLLAIDLQVGSVILKAIIVPSFQELAMLAAIVGIKIVLGWTLSKEVNRHHDQGLRWYERGRGRIEDQPQQQPPFGQQSADSKNSDSSHQ
ncbi:MAG: DUF1622 domain-containing protein [Thermoproteota archaeon]|nr:DUF1622 domain-containing protein [Thermoproteota archaeon]